MVPRPKAFRLGEYDILRTVSSTFRVCTCVVRSVSTIAIRRSSEVAMATEPGYASESKGQTVVAFSAVTAEYTRRPSDA